MSKDPVDSYDVDDAMQPIQTKPVDADLAKASPTPPPGLWDGQAPIGSITSPSETGKYRMVLRDYASTVQVEGSLVTLDYNEVDGTGQQVTKTVLCLASHTSSENIHHENALLRSLLREKGRIPGLSGVADHKEVDLLPMDTVLLGSDVHQLPRNVPAMGTDVRFASVDDVAHFSGAHPTLFNIGHLYETRVPIGLLLKHFGDNQDGWGDARMLGVFGATGSGKTVIAASIVAGFAARSEMGMLIVDPQGQFSASELGKKPTEWSWCLDEAFRRAGRGTDVMRVRIDEVAFESPRLFAELLSREGFYEALSILGHEKQERVVQELAMYLSEWLREDSKRKLGHLEFNSKALFDNDVLDVVCTLGASTYAHPEDKARDIRKALEASPIKIDRARRIWEEVRERFNRRYSVSALLDSVLIHRKIVLLNVDTQEKLKDLYCAEILDGIKRKAEAIYRVKQGQSWRGDLKRKYEHVETNALIVIDEAHRFAPQFAGRNDDSERMLGTLTDAIRTTRKLGVGWMYITQSLAEFNKGVLRQLQTKVLGIGIGSGADADHLETALNYDSDLIKRYRNLPRPTVTGVYPFAIIGELVALGNGNKALFISAFKEQQDLFDLNPNHFKHVNGAPVPKTPSLSSTGPGSSQTPGGDAPDAEETDIPF